jgi:pimeloyl-ACP methyl ester carboxylesterase
VALAGQSTGAKIKIPLLVICGEKDALLTSKACQAQKDLYSGSRSASLESVPRAGHADARAHCFYLSRQDRALA